MNVINVLTLKQRPIKFLQIAINKNRRPDGSPIFTRFS
jgi:hypothetical protein